MGKISQLFDADSREPFTKGERDRLTLASMPLLLDDRPGSQIAVLIARYEATIVALERKLQEG